MRKFLGLATLLGLLAFVAVATAGEVGPSPSGQFQSLEVTHKPAKPKKPTILTVTVAQRTADGSQPILTTESDVHLPKGMKLGYKDFPTCNPTNLKEGSDPTKPPTGCPAKSRVGKGLGRADARTLGITDPIEAPVWAFNGKKKGGKPSYILWANSPIEPNITLVGTLEAGNVLKIPIPQGLPLCGALGDPNQCAGIIYFTVTTGATLKKKKKVHGKKKTVKIPYLTNPKTCPSGGYPWSLDFSYKNGEKLTPTDTVPC
jgi:hypothetical protein